MSNHRETVTAPGAPAAAGPYSHAVRSQGFLFCSGQVGLDPETNQLVGESYGEQARQALTNLTTVAAAAGATLADAVRMSIYVTDMGAFAEVNEVYAEFFPDPPARSTIGVTSLPLGAKVEIDAVIALG
jgi:2-iminobutanoate/2-iminopropanoate deaminase